MVTGEKEEGEKDGWWSVRSHRNRMIIYSPEPDFFIYVVSPSRVSELKEEYRACTSADNELDRYWEQGEIRANLDCTRTIGSYDRNSAQEGLRCLLRASLASSLLKRSSYTLHSHLYYRRRQYSPPHWTNTGPVSLSPSNPPTSHHPLHSFSG